MIQSCHQRQCYTQISQLLESCLLESSLEAKLSTYYNMTILVKVYQDCNFYGSHIYNYYFRLIDVKLPVSVATRYLHNFRNVIKLMSIQTYSARITWFL